MHFVPSQSVDAETNCACAVSPQSFTAVGSLLAVLDNIDEARHGLEIFVPAIRKQNADQRKRFSLATQFRGGYPELHAWLHAMQLTSTFCFEENGKQGAPEKSLTWNSPTASLRHHVLDLPFRFLQISGEPEPPMGSLPVA